MLLIQDGVRKMSVIEANRILEYDSVRVGYADEEIVIYKNEPEDVCHSRQHE